MEPNNTISIPILTDWSKFEANQERAYEQNLDHCSCCGKAIKNPQYFIQSIYGGSMYPKADKQFYNDAWVMGIGSECRKKLPIEYVMDSEEVKLCTI